MQPLDYADPAVEERWCSECRQRVSEYLARQGVRHGEVGEWPAWHVAPYVYIWAIESVRHPGHVGWWAICGDLPTDYLSVERIKHPREAMQAFSEVWLEVAQCMTDGVPHSHIRIGPADQATALSPLLESRAKLLSTWAADDAAGGLNTTKLSGPYLLSLKTLGPSAHPPVRPPQSG